MSAAKTRWVCPTCGSGVLGPKRPRRDDVRRYCLDCSGKGGRLVERISPAVERLREQGAERSKRKAEAKKARERAKRDRYFNVTTETAAGVTVVVDTEREVKRLARLAGCEVHKLVVHRRYGYGRGHARPWDREIYIAVQDGMRWETLVQLLAHEVAHVARNKTLLGVGYVEDGDLGHHGEAFRKRLAKLVAKAYPGTGRIPWSMNSRRQWTAIDDRLKARSLKAVAS